MTKRQQAICEIRQQLRHRHSVIRLNDWHAEALLPKEKKKK